MLFGPILVLLLTTVQQPDFTGTWERNPKLSQDPFQKIERALGSGQSSVSGGRQSDVYSRTGLLRDVDRVTLRRMLMDFAEVLDRIEVEYGGGELKVWVGNDDYFSLFYLDGEPHSRELQEGVFLEATASLNGDSISVVQKGEAGGLIRENYSLLDGGKQLAVVFQIEHKASETPVMFRTVYDRVE
ncbi:MAG TPA: hypothetical protein VLK65_02205 [Vicinamibacteria bacterium]|nr:hypothetical protein [Vicinamibacteria bacterium]